MDYKFGLLPQPIDERNYKLNRLCNTEGVEIPKSFCLLPDRSKLKIQNQGQISCCFGEQEAYINWCIEYLRYNIDKPFSVGWAYGNRSATDNQGPGIIAQEGLKHYIDEGIVYLEDFQELKEMPDIENDVSSVKNSLLLKANKHRIKAYAELTTLDEIKLALLTLKTPVFIGVPIFQSFFSAMVNGKVSIYDPNKEQCLGLHAMSIWGWDENNYLLSPNSWGADFGDKGWNYFPGDFVFDRIYALTDDEVSPDPEGPKTYYRVQVYAFKNRNNADSAVTKLAAQCVNACLVYDDGYYKIQCGCFASIENRDNMINKLKELGYNPYIITIQK